jgi:hypothetical protein
MPSTVFGKTLWRCDQGHEWETNYHRLDDGHGCPHCTGQYPKSSDDYHALAESRGYQWVGPEAANTKTKTFWRCPEKHSWDATYNNIAKRTNCPYCFLLEKQSKGEKQVAQILDALDILYSRQKGFDGCKDKKALRYDFYFSFSGHQFLIEYNGEQHYKPIERWGGAKGLEDVQRRDRIKAHFAAANHLHLITIPCTDFDRIGTIIIDRLTEATGESPLTFRDVIERSQGIVEPLEGIQLSFDFQGRIKYE